MSNTGTMVHFTYYATGITPAMAFKRVGKGSQFAAALTDPEGKPLARGHAALRTGRELVYQKAAR